MPKRSKAEQNKIDEQLETDWDKEIAKRRRTDRKAKSSNLKCWEFNIPIDREEFGEKCYKQGKKDAEKKCPYATGIPPYFKKAKEKCIVVIGERDIIRKQTLSEVLKDLRLRVGKHNNWFFIRFGYIEELEQKLKAME